MSKRYVLTGGPGVGKTTLINVLAKKGYQTVPEAYAVLYKQAQNAHMLDTFFNDPVALYARILEEQLRLESELSDAAPTFLDRSAVDIIAFAHHFKVPFNIAFYESVQQRYDIIFFLEPLPVHLYEQTMQRKETIEEAFVIHKLLQDAYQKNGYQEDQCIAVPFGTASERIAYIMSQI